MPPMTVENRHGVLAVALALIGTGLLALAAWISGGDPP